MRDRGLAGHPSGVYEQGARAVAEIELGVGADAVLDFVRQEALVQYLARQT